MCKTIIEINNACNYKQANSKSTKKYDTNNFKYSTNKMLFVKKKLV